MSREHFPDDHIGLLQFPAGAKHLEEDEYDGKQQEGGEDGYGCNQGALAFLGFEHFAGEVQRIEAAAVFLVFIFGEVFVGFFQVPEGCSGAAFFQIQGSQAGLCLCNQERITRFLSVSEGFLVTCSGLFQLTGIQQERVFFIKNIRIANGAVPLYDRLASDGKIVTYAITFDTGKATLRPEADVEIGRIKGIMDQDASLKFEVQGHCDSTGSDAVNDPLSQKRAEAIVARLVELGIAKDRLTAVGKGSHEPIADNATDEGRAKNRRVEFVKQ